MNKPRCAQRNLGIDLLRILCMFMVVILHVVGVAGMLDAAAGEPGKFEQLKLIQIGAMCAVNCYGLISGYVGWRTKFRISSIVTLWLQVFLYSAGLGVIFYFWMPDMVSLKDLVKLCLPVLMQRYWYFTAYFALFFIMPLLNAAVQHLPRRQLECALVCLLFLLTVCQSVVIVNDVFRTNSGYSCLWLVVLYCVGGYIGKYGVQCKRVVSAAAFVAGVLVCWMAQFALRKLGIGSEDRLAAYNSPVVFLMGVALLLLFKDLQLPTWAERIVKIMAPASFGVYLIHLHPLVRNFLLLDRFRPFVQYPIWSMVPLVLGLSLAIYLVCSGVDLLRHWAFRKLKVKQRMEYLNDRLFSKQDEG